MQTESRAGAPEAPTARRTWIGVSQLAGFASLGAGAVHAAAAGIHAEHPSLSRLFVAVAAAQIAVGIAMLVRSGRGAAAVTAVVNAGAVVAWAVTRFAGISWVPGLDQSEAPQFADSVCAALGGLAVIAAVTAFTRPGHSVVGRRLILPATALGALSVAAMMTGATHEHSHDGVAAAAGHDHPTEAGADIVANADHEHDATDAAATAAGATDATAATDDHEHTDATATGAAHDHTDETAAAADPAAEVVAAWPRPWDPTAPVDFSGVDGVTPEQQARAEALAVATLEQLPQFADVTTLPALGYKSIGDAGTGHEHYVNIGYIGDDSFLDPSRPESLVYAVDGEQRTLVSAMFIAKDTALDDPALIDYGGPLMQWHVHQNLCWSLDAAGQPVVVAVLDAAGNCPAGSVNAGGDNPMVHVWIAPHECGPFAALEGHGAGQTASDGTRTDQCAHEHGTDAEAATADEHAGHDAATVAPTPYDPAKPIDLSGVDGVTPQQQAFAENLIATTVVQLPQWADPAAAEAAGFHSIGDEATGHEHYIQWDWIDDDVYLDPDAPESLVYEPQPDGSKRLVSAMYMLPNTTALDAVPEWGGKLMQWHIHDNLCYSDDPVAPQVRGLTSADGTCRAPLVKRLSAPMIHVWITPHECGPFASLEGVGAGAIAEGEDRWCDHAHGS